MNTFEEKENTSDTHSYLSFKLGDEVFAIIVYKVLNIIEMLPITKVPQAPVYMKGVINLRGSVLPVVDLRVKFGLPAAEQTADTCIIVLNLELNSEETLIGIMVDGVEEVLEIKNDQIKASPGIGTRYNSNFIQGMYAVKEAFTMILDIDKVFSVNDIITLKETEEVEKPIQK
jgi:purine-binding chemotaxis protein CheW